MSKRRTDEELALITALAKIRKELATKGIDFDSDSGKLSYSEMLELYRQIRMKELDEKLKAADKEFEDEDEKKEAILDRIKVQDQDNIPKVMKITTENNKKIEENSNKHKKRKKTWIKITSGIIVGGLVLTGIATLSSNIGEKLYYGHVKKEKMAPYKEMLDHVVLSNSHPMYKTRDVGNGEHESFSEYWLDYGKIATAIKESDNPDLALYTLYHYFGKTSDPMYEGITNKTCKYFEFTNENGELKKGDLYDFASGFDRGNKTDEEILKEYDEVCDTDLKYDFDSSLDNLKYKINVKPLTKSYQNKNRNF